MSYLNPDGTRPLLEVIQTMLSARDVEMLGVDYEPFYDLQAQHAYMERIAQGLRGQELPVLVNDDAERLIAARSDIVDGVRDRRLETLLYLDVILLSQYAKVPHGDIDFVLTTILSELVDTACMLSNECVLTTGLFLQWLSQNLDPVDPVVRKDCEMALVRLALTWTLRLAQATEEDETENRREPRHPLLIEFGARMGWRRPAVTFLSEPWAALAAFLDKAHGPPQTNS